MILHKEQTMDMAVPPELEELIICSNCHSPFNDTDAIPKLFSCRHYFCLRCVGSFMQQKRGELYCIHCWKRTELSGPDITPDSLQTYGAILYLAQNLDVLSLKTNAPSTSAGGRNAVAAIGIRKQRSSSSTSSSIASSSGNGHVNGTNGGVGTSGASNDNSTSLAACAIGNIVNGATSLDQEPAVRVRSNSNGVVIGENCMTHAMPHTLWCGNCHILVCRACAGSEEHRGHIVKSHTEAREQIQVDISNELKSMQRTLSDVQHFVYKQRDFLLRILESCSALKTKIETELMSHVPTTEICEMRESLGRARICLELLQNQTPTDALKLYSTLHVEKQRLQAKYQEMFLQCKLDELIRNYCSLFDFNVMQQVLAQLHSYILNGIPVDAFVGGGGAGCGVGGVGSGIGANSAQNGMASHHNPVLLLANYCIAQLYSRHLTRQHQLQQQQQAHIFGNGFAPGGFSQQQQQQQHLPLLSPPQSLSSQSSPRDSILTYADVTLSPQNLPHPSQQNKQQHLNLDGFTSGNHLGSLAVAVSAGNGGACNGSNGTDANGFTSAVNAGSVSDGILAIAPLGAIGQPIRMPSAPSVVFPTPGDLNGIGLSLLHIQQQQQQAQQQNAQQHSSQLQKSTSANSTNNNNNILCNPSAHIMPIYYFNIEMNGQTRGRILIEVRADVAPKMAQNFAALATQELGFGYKGCHIFQCWENESIITGDFELNNGRGGRSVFDEGYFMPDDTKIVAQRGSVGMRRSQKRHDNLGLVGSQFRIILREMRGFTGIFAHVVEGLELVERISQTGDSAGKPQTTVVIVSCGKYQ